MKRQATGAAVRDAFGNAQNHAAALAAPPPVWRAAGSRRRSTRWFGLGALAIAIGGGLGWAWVASSTPDPSTAALPVDAIVRNAPPGAGLAAVPTPGALATVPPPVSTPAPAPAAPSLAVTRRGGVIRMDLSDAPLAAAVKALADATHTTIRGGDALLALTTERSTLRWEGSSPVAAWDALLGRLANTAVSCSATACELWIVGSNAPRGAGARAGGPTAGPEAAQPARPSTGPVAVPQPEPQDTETN